MKQIAIATVKNAQRHFIVWGAFAVILMFAGIHENQNGTPASAWDRPPATGTLEQVLNDNVCEDTVEGEFPTAVVLYNMHTGGYEYSTDANHIGKGLDELFADKEWKGYEVRHFCK